MQNVGRKLSVRVFPEVVFPLHDTQGGLNVQELWWEQGAGLGSTAVIECLEVLQVDVATPLDIAEAAAVARVGF